MSEPWKPNSIAIEVRRLTIAVASKSLINDISLSLGAGRIHGLLGANGAGKSTLMRAILGLLRRNRTMVATGSILVQGKPLDSLSTIDLAKSFAYLPVDQEPAFDFLVKDIVQMGRQVHHLGAPSPADLQAADAALAQLNISHLSPRRFSGLSTGEKAKVGLARCLVTEAPILCLDEPTGNLDVGAALQLQRTLKIMRDQGKTILFTTHDLNEASSLADDVYLLKSGELLTSGPTRAALTAEMILDCFGVEARRIDYDGGDTLVFASPPQP